jgi:RNA polymerase sigma factor (sigma-70 family)
VVDRHGFERFFESRYPGVVRACVLVVLDRDTAEEVAAEAFTVLWRRWDELTDEDHAGGFVYKTAMRLCVKNTRRSMRERLGEVPEMAAADESGVVARRRDVFAALAELPMRQRQAVVLRDWAGFETEDIAQMLGTRASTVRVHLARGREAMRTRLATKEPR